MTLLGASGRRAARALGCALLAASIVTLSAPLRSAQPDKAAAAEARSRYDRGKQLYEEGAYDAALIEFQRAYELAPSFRILYNIGQVYRQQNDYAGALKSYERYLAEGGKDIDAKRRTEVDGEIGQLRGRVATLQITTSVSGAEVSIDDVSIGRTPLAQPVMVNAGKRRVSAAKAGRVPVTKVVTLAGADALQVDLDLVEPGAPPASAASGKAPAPSAVGPPAVAPPPRVPWIGWALTGAFAVGAGVTGALALKASGDLKNERNDPAASRQNLDSERSKTKTLALVSDVFSGAAVIAGGVSLYFTLRAPPREAPLSASSPLELRSVKLGLGPGGVRVLGAF